jgi:hypothetical protein
MYKITGKCLMTSQNKLNQQEICSDSLMLHVKLSITLKLMGILFEILI